jgi:Cys-tRNA(Pro)/Cys-tRNA(Cys) deacylase
MKKTNAARLLDGLGIEYEFLEYEVDEEDLSAEHVAQELELPVEQVFKTLVVRGDRQGIVICCIPGNGELNLKKVAMVTGNKRVELVPSKEILGLTGYLRGGCSPVGMKKRYPTLLDRGALEYDSIVVSAGVRGAQLKLAPTDLVKATTATIEELAIEGEK